MATARVYAGSFPADQKFRGQAALIVAALAAGPKTVEQVAKEITEGEGEKLQTRQDPVRVVSFYMSVWKKKGWVKAEDVQRDEPAGPVSEEAGQEAGVNPEDAASTGATAEQLAEADVESQMEALSQDMKVSEAVLFTLRKQPEDGLEPLEIVEYLNGHGYAVKLEQVRGALQNLVRRGTVTHEENNYRVAPVTAGR